MKRVRDECDELYHVLKQSGSSTLVRNLRTGDTQYLENDRLEPLEGTSAYEDVARVVSDDIRALITAVHDERTLGLLITIAATGPLPARDILDTDDSCESDLHGRLVALRTAGLLEQTTVGGERGYETTSRCERALEYLRSDD